MSEKINPGKEVESVGDKALAVLSETIRANQAEAARVSLELFNADSEIESTTVLLDKAKEKAAGLRKQLGDISVLLDVTAQIQTSVLSDKTVD